MYDIFEKLLNERGITAYRIAKETGISTATLTQWKNGTSTPKNDKLQKIAEYFNVSVDYLMGNSEIPGTDESVKEILAAKDGLYFKFAKQAEELDLSEEDLQFILNTYMSYKKHRDRQEK